MIVALRLSQVALTRVILSFLICYQVILVIALYFPDLFIILAASENTALDAMLTIVFLIFLLEWLLMSVLDMSYFLGFFWVMDMVGTFSMFFDISYILGSDATEPLIVEQQVGRGGSGDQTQLLRAARVAKLGARAGRISRVVKVLRFMPFLNLKDQDSSQMARVISSQLTNVLATRVACLTIILVIVVPLLGFFQFPEYDYSINITPKSFFSRYNEYVKDFQGPGVHPSDSLQQPAITLVRLQNSFKSADIFYKSTLETYGVFQACLAICVNQQCTCFVHDMLPEVPYHDWYFDQPNRIANVIHVMQKSESIVPAFTFVVSYNLEQVYRQDSWMNLLMISFVILVMVTFGLVLSNSVSDLALKPMERMLAMVRAIAATVFKTVDNLQEADGMDSDDDDIANASEMVLLEKVVNRLARMAELQQRTAQDVGIKTEDLKDEELGVLNLIQQNVRKDDLEVQKRVQNRVSSKQVHIDPKILGVTEQQYNSWDLHAIDIQERKQRIAFAVFCVLEFPGCAAYCHERLKTDTMIKFVQQVETEYMDHPYHNFYHALDVCFTTQRMMKLSFTSLFMQEIEQMSLLISAICHDIGHPGVNNPFLVDTSHELAVRYNDRSPLENMHCARLFSIPKEDDGKNIFQNFTQQEYKDIRKICVEVILHTDMTQHFAMIKEISMLQLQINEDDLDLIDPTEGPGEDEIERLKVSETRSLLLKLLLHAADVSNPCKPWHICHFWAKRVLNEFFNQGDKEKELDIPVQMLNDREKVNIPNSQIGFIEFVVAPLVITMVKLLPPLYELSRHIHLNVCHWADILVEESKPGEEEKTKLQQRVEKLRTQTEEAEARIYFPGAPVHSPSGNLRKLMLLE